MKVGPVFFCLLPSFSPPHLRGRIGWGIEYNYIMDLNKTIAEIASLATPGTTVYIVGGTVRDMLLNKNTVDIDIAVSEGAEEFARRAAEMIGGTSFVLDGERNIFRAARSGLSYHIDVSQLRGSIEEDLALRDFTINAMAIPAPENGRFELIDPLGRQKDLKAGIVRAVTGNVFTDDPLRLLRAFRLSLQLGFAIEDDTLGLIKAQRGLIKEASAERVRDELYLMLGQGGAADTFRAMYAAGLLQEVLPELEAMEGVPQTAPHEHDVLEHSFMAMYWAGVVMTELPSYFGLRAAEVSGYLDTQVDGLLGMNGLVKLCALLHDTGKPGVFTVEPDRIRFTGHDLEGEAINASIARRLRLSGSAARTLGNVTRAHLRPMHLSKSPVTRRAVYRYVRDMGDDLPASLIVALSDAFATRERPGAISTDVEGLVLDIAEYYYGEFGKMKAEPLITGIDIIEVLGLEPGPVFGVILNDVEEKRVEGVVTDREGAIKFIRDNYAGGSLPG